MDHHWNWSLFFDPATGGRGPYLDLLLEALRWTLATALASWTIAFILGSLVAMMRTAPSRPARVVAGAWISLFFAVPLLLQMLLWWALLPDWAPPSLDRWNLHWPPAPFSTAVLALGLYSSARVAVRIEAGLAALPAGLAQAGRAAGFKTVQLYRYALLPLAYRAAGPSLAGAFLDNMKNTSVAFAIGLLEVTAQTRAMQQSSPHALEALSAAIVIYLALALLVWPLARVLEWGQARRRALVDRPA